MAVADAEREAENKARNVSRSPVFRALVKAGLVAVGIVHILIGALALQMAWTSRPNAEVDQQGALQVIAANPAGEVLLWVVAVGLCALVLWKLTQAWWGYGYESKRGARIRKRLGALGAAAAYAVLAATAIRFGLGDSGQSSDSAQQTRVGMLLSEPYGPYLAVLAALCVVGYACVLIKRGVSGSFTKELDGEPNPAMKRFGQVGFIAKGVAIALIGVLFGWAGVTYDPEKAAGLDGALQTVNQQPAGPFLLSLVALGLIAYGLYCFSWARHART